jgi:hypothetical protein
MTVWRQGTFVSFSVATVIFAVASSAAAQNSLPAARDLYVAAAYEDALQLLNRLRASEHRGDEGRSIEQYRAFCLIALGRRAEAESAIESLVKASPLFRPTDEDASPRVRAAFGEVRRRTLPSIVQRTYETAKAAFDRKDPASARTFALVLELIADPDLGPVANQPPLSELRTLATGFLALSTPPAPAAPLPQASQLPPAAPLPQASQPPPAAPMPQASQPPPALLPASPGPPPAPRVVAPPPRSATNRVYSPDDVNVTPPIVVRQSFAPLADVFAVRPGIVEVIIDEVGDVVAAKTIVSVNAVYDRIALATARSWRYRPATLDGVAVRFRTLVQLQMKLR